jgi:hypothetical protein
MRKKYFISYALLNGFGSTELKLDKKIKSIDDIRKIEAELKKELQADISIINYVLLGYSWK